ncbi:sulfite exporter TauE/SafE family protein [Chromobacterium violaceum]|uniref:Probable membrane transporter protein n=1 Tax=Chromobacterium violaceum TaxID=536 RepID=A0AAX2M790_CHRVL|nr:TSUP family transporter [Chromobacterium violaceum]MBP4049462.1 TSUP family transporter [Chromobacterium violaceum]MBX9266798.1 TSUP family transporter [Chromobacterium violaceum]STB63951.1 Sulfite exporter TauE/SafE [Chromobacterium violaceum]SUX32280.1 Sulfite exporter TauE/SafE [Chromobacterium violaceum]
MLLSLSFLCLIAFCAGLVDAAVGGGGLIQIPGLFSALPNAAPATIFGTNKLSAAVGTLSAARSYLSRVKLPWRLVLPAAATAFVFSFAGAAAVSQIPKGVIRPLVLVLLLVMAVYTLWKKDFGKLHKPVAIGRREMATGMAIGGAIGFYDGLFGPGTGSFLMFLFIRFFAFDFLHASAAAKVVNLTTNVAALIFFVGAGHVLYQFALPMAAANMAGAMVGTRLAMKKGAGFVRVLFLGLTSVLICKLAWDILHG